MRHKHQNELNFDRAAALIALTAVAAYDYGVRIWMLFGIAAAVSLLAEYICLRIRGRRFRRRHLDAAVSGIILLMLLPPTVPVTVLIMSCIFAIIIGRGLFGGMENSVIPSATAGFCFAALNNRADITMYPAAKAVLPLNIPESLALTEGFSGIWNRHGTFAVADYDLVTTVPAQPVGSASVVLLIVIAVVLMLRRSASAWVILPAAVPAVIYTLFISNLRTPLAYAAACCLTNQFLFSLIFLYGDPRHASMTVGDLLTGLTVGLASVVLTRFCYVTDAPVYLCIMLSPVMLWVRRLFPANSRAASPKGGGIPDEGNLRAEPR